MRFNPIAGVFKGGDKPATKLMTITPPRTGERTMLGVENLLSSIAVPEPFSLEIVGDSGGVSLLARCRDGSFVRQQVGGRYPQARVNEASLEDDPLRLSEEEQAYSTSLRLRGPEYLPLRTFRDDDLLDPGSDPLISVIGSLSDLEEGEAAGGPAEAALPGTRVVQRPPGEGVRQAVGGPEQLSPSHQVTDRPQRRGDHGHHWAHCRAGAPVLPVGAAGGDVEGGAAGTGRGFPGGPGGLGLVAHQEVALRGQVPGPDAHPGEGLPHRLRGPAGGDGDSVGARYRVQG